MDKMGSALDDAQVTLGKPDNWLVFLAWDVSAVLY